LDHGAASLSRAPLDAMVEEHYAEFRRIARSLLRADNVAQHVQATELAHEAVLRMIRLDRMNLDGRTHFLSLAARVMRQVMVDEARRMRASKRQAPMGTAWPDQPTEAPIDLEDLDIVLRRLEAVDPDKARIIEQRIFVGLTIEEIAEFSGLSESTVKRQWRVARAWLIHELG